MLSDFHHIKITLFKKKKIQCKIDNATYDGILILVYEIESIKCLQKGLRIVNEKKKYQGLLSKN